MALNIESIWNDYRTKVFHFVKRRVSDPGEAEDITQDVFVKIFQKIESLQTEDKLQSWLFQITRNAIIDYYRSKKPTSELPELPQADEDSVAKTLIELSECLQPMIARLPQHYQESIILSEIEGKTHRDISETLGISQSGSKSRVQRGRVMIKEMLMECCQLEFDKKGRLSDFEKKDEACEGCG